MRILSACVADLLAEHKFISKEKVEICRYGLENLITSFLEILSILVLSIIFNNVVCTIIFLASFISLRRYTGGYHASTKLRCYVVLLVIYLIFILIIKHMPAKYDLAFEITSLSFTIFMVFRYAPIVNGNKNINETERKMFRRLGIILALVSSGFIVLGMVICPHNKGVLSVSAGQLVVSTSMLAAIFMKRRCR